MPNDDRPYEQTLSLIELVRDLESARRKVKFTRTPNEDAKGRAMRRIELIHTELKRRGLNLNEVMDE